MPKIIKNRIDSLLQYTLVASGQGSGWERELRVIHWIKYVYLADLDCAR